MLLGLLCFGLSAHAQDQPAAVVEGVVTDSAGTTLPGVNVRIRGTQKGTSTAPDGSYRISSISPGQRTVVASFVGYQTVRRTIRLEPGETRTLNITLVPAAVGMEEMVVTALGVDREERSLGYAVENVSGAELAETQEVNIMNSLAGKVAGVTITSGSAGLASTPTVTIRGESSLSGENRPLYVVDGVPINNTPNTQAAASQSTQVDFGNGLSQINPENIKEMSVLKGPSAAALYGSRAANGVVLIETKDGSGTDGIGASVNTGVTFSSPLRVPDYQNEYSYGNGGRFRYVDGTNAPGWNWGVPLDEGVKRPQFRGPRNENGNLVPTPVTSAPNNVREFFQTGANYTTNVALRGGDENGSFRASISRSDRTGIVPNTELRATNTSLSGSYDITDALTVDGNAQYTKTTSANLPTSGYGSESTMYFFTWGARHLDFQSRLRPYWRQKGVQQAHNDLNWTNNPYFQVHENTSSLDRDRLFGNLSVRYQAAENLDVRVRSGIDFSDQLTKQRKAFSTITAKNGWMRESTRNFLEWNTNLLVNYSYDVTDEITVEPSVGANYMRQTRRTLQLTAPALSVPGVYNIGNSRASLQTSELEQAEEIFGVFGTSTISYQEVLFLDLTARNDWSSTLPLDNNSYFYPSASLSFIASDFFDIAENTPISFAKVRASWAQVGNDTEPFRLRNTFSFQPAWGGTQTVVSESNLSNPELKPEITTSWEVGTNIQLFSGRVGLDATYYRRSTRDQILRVPLASATGYDSRLVNAGKVRNYGFEANLQLTPVRDYKGFGWDISLNWTRSRSTIVELADQIDVFQIANPLGGGTVQAREGGRMGDIYGRVFKRVQDSDSPHHGEIIYEGGLPQLTEEVQKIGNYNHDWQGGIGTTLSYRDFQFEAFFDVRQGGVIYSYMHATTMEGGTVEGTTCCRAEPVLENGQDGTVIGDGVVADGNGGYKPNETPAPYVTWLRQYNARTNVEANSFDASYVKLRQVSLTYNYSSDWLAAAGVQNLGVSVIGRNLLLFTDVPHIDPETTVANGTQRTPGFEQQQIPSRRTYGFNVQLDF
ncbi:MAG: SusC/RagA family TonB-linked outer membrane protein [Salinibacter sp.]|uniref:SusC/RagA family TonB-linked outer membrane protein n=1 Tax=Salinibacter sp. TaxID=2065818 RepID=UPI0035D50B6D